jgi:hypothetical protein
MASAPRTEVTVATRPPGRRVSATTANAATTGASPNAAWAAAQPGPPGITQPRPETTPPK